MPLFTKNELCKMETQTNKMKRNESKEKANSVNLKIKQINAVEWMKLINRLRHIRIVKAMCVLLLRSKVL